MARTTDTTKPIWEYEWKVSIPQLQTTSASYIKHFGMPSSGDPDIDRELARQWITTYRTIDQMVEYHRAGVPFKLLVAGDAQKIYNYVEEHLQGWLYNMKNSLNIGDVPVDDLIAMNDFANTLHKYTSYSYKESEAVTSFQRAISDMGFNALHARFTAPSKVEQASWKDHKQEVRRKDLASDIKSFIKGYSLNDR